MRIAHDRIQWYDTTGRSFPSLGRRVIPRIDRVPGSCAMRAHSTMR
jgi:hypothetical protein